MDSIVRLETCRSVGAVVARSHVFWWWLGRCTLVCCEHDEAPAVALRLLVLLLWYVFASL